MKAVVYSFHGERKLGVLRDRDMSVQALSLPCGLEGWDSERLLSMRPNDIASLLTDVVHPIHDVTLLAPVPRPLRNILCVGKNYHEHARAFSASGFDSSAAAGAIPKARIAFLDVPDCMVGPKADVVIDPAFSSAIDYEAELAVVIGEGGRGIRRADALNHAWGDTIINDVTARDARACHSQCLLGKPGDTFGPLGPWLVTRDEVGDEAIQLRCWINGGLRQDAGTRDLIFDLPTLIETRSTGMTLMPRDMIATGTSAGVGIGFQPPRDLSHGNHMKIEITKLGTLENRIVDRSFEVDES